MLNLAIPGNMKNWPFPGFPVPDSVHYQEPLRLLLQWKELMKFTVLLKKVNFLKYLFI